VSKPRLTQSLVTALDLLVRHFDIDVPSRKAA
jgi:hypothetical protein